MKTIRDFNVNGKRVLVRCDFNVPLSEQGDLLDDFRIKAVLPTVKYLIEQKAKVILMSHLGRPSNNPDPKFSLKPVALRIEKLLKKKVKFKEIEKMKQGEVALLENLRFYKEEEQNDENFAKNLAKLGDIYINDAFGVCHRAHASVVGLPKYLSSGIGFLLEKEIKTLENLMKNPKKPLIAIIGGKKVETKVNVIDKLSLIADFVLIGNLLRDELRQKKIRLKFSEKIIEPIDGIEVLDKELDIGPKTIKIFQEKISQAKTIFWNGPLGLTEDEKFIQGSLDVADAIIKSPAYSIAGGGDLVAFLGKYNLRNKFNYVSTGGGAMLKFLSGEELPGLKALQIGVSLT
jgi:phosphoglycerate kinase